MNPGRITLAWFRPCRSTKFVAADVTMDVSFEPVTGAINERIDDAYHAKYSKSSYLGPMTAARARSATVKIIPRD